MDLKEHPAVKKAVWAGRRLTELEEAVKEYSDKRPFTVRRRPQQKKLEWELVFTEEIPEEIGFMAGDFVYNARASLDYLAGTLVPPEKLRSSYYPILDRRVWETPVAENEDENLSGQRRRWAFIETYMPPKAVEVIKERQPESLQTKKGELIPRVAVLNSLSNSDRHRKLTIVQQALHPSGLSTYTHADGHQDQFAFEEFPRPRAFHDRAVIPKVPDSVTSIDLGGNVRLFLKAGDQHVDINDLRQVWLWVLETIGLLTIDGINDPV